MQRNSQAIFIVLVVVIILTTAYIFNMSLQSQKAMPRIATEQRRDMYVALLYNDNHSYDTVSDLIIVNWDTVVLLNKWNIVEYSDGHSNILVEGESMELEGGYAFQIPLGDEINDYLKISTGLIDCDYDTNYEGENIYWSIWAPVSLSQLLFKLRQFISMRGGKIDLFSAVNRYVPLYSDWLHRRIDVNISAIEQEHTKRVHNPKIKVVHNDWAVEIHLNTSEVHLLNNMGKVQMTDLSKEINPHAKAAFLGMSYHDKYSTLYITVHQRTGKKHSYVLIYEIPTCISTEIKIDSSEDINSLYVVEVKNHQCVLGGVSASGEYKEWTVSTFDRFKHPDS